MYVYIYESIEPVQASKSSNLTNSHNWKGETSKAYLQVVTLEMGKIRFCQ